MYSKLCWLIDSEMYLQDYGTVARHFNHCVATQHGKKIITKNGNGCNIINKCLNYLFMIGETSICKAYVTNKKLIRIKARMKVRI